jgi:hypothetical protein
MICRFMVSTKSTMKYKSKIGQNTVKKRGGGEVGGRQGQRQKVRTAQSGGTAFWSKTWNIKELKKSHTDRNERRPR